MDFRQEKIRVFQHLLEQGMPQAEFTKAMTQAGVQVPDMIRSRWLKQLDSVKLPHPNNQRLVNRFMMGADPEFVITNRDNEYKYAEGLGLDTLRAFGADMSGRQAELRVYPSRSCVELVASVMDTLKWMNVFMGHETLEWKAPSYFVRDGCGGHVHFGRRRPYRPREIKNLDIATGLLLNAQVLDSNGQRDRVAGGYGRNGDFRLQPHGYEYRSLPTWMCSPEVAYITLVVAKLTLLHPQPFAVKAASSIHQIMNLLALYKGQDDDAAIAYAWIRRNGLPHYQEGNFKARWGVGPAVKSADLTEIRQNPSRYYIPEVIKPSEYAKNTIFNYLTKYQPIPLDDVREVTWDLFKLPKDVYNIGVQPHQGGLSEIVSGLVSKGIKVMAQVSPRNGALTIMTPMQLDIVKITEAAKELMPSWNGRVYLQNYQTFFLSFPPNIYQNHLPFKPLCNGFRALISNSKLFPICKGTRFNEVEWPEKYADDPKPVKFIGHQIQI